MTAEPLDTEETGFYLIINLLWELFIADNKLMYKFAILFRKFLH